MNAVLNAQSNREALAELLEQLPCGEELAEAWLLRILTHEGTLAQLNPSDDERRAVEEFVWTRRLGD